MKLATIILGSVLAMSVQASAMAGEVDINKSKIKWLGTKVTGKHFGEIGIKSAKLRTSGDRIKSGEVIVDVNKIDVTDLSGEWKDKFITHMKSADFFEVEKFPTAKFVITKDTGKALHGKLTIKGKTHPVKMAYTREGSMYKGELKFDRTKYDMVYGSGDFFKNLGDKMIHNEVKLDFEIAVKHKGQQTAQK